MLQVGDKIPDFSVVDQDKNTFSNADLLGKKSILFFYPQDNTPACTAEACNLRDNYKGLKAKGFSLYGISPDSPRKHQNFIRKFELQYTLLSDPERSAIEGFGVWGPKKFMGREYVGLLRTTFVVNEEGIIELVVNKVKTKDHTNQILTMLAESAST